MSVRIVLVAGQIRSNKLDNDKVAYVRRENQMYM